MSVHVGFKVTSCIHVETKLKSIKVTEFLLREMISLHILQALAFDYLEETSSKNEERTSVCCRVRC